MHEILQKSQIKICNFFFITCFDHPNSTVSQLVRIIEILLYNIYNTQVSTCLHTIYCRYCPFQCRNSVSIFFFFYKKTTNQGSFIWCVILYAGLKFNKYFHVCNVQCWDNNVRENRRIFLCLRTGSKRVKLLQSQRAM